MHLDRLIREEMAAKGKDGIMFLCIGTDRSTGDSLGPLVGHMLRSRRLKGAAVIGTLDKPVHAMNLDLYASIYGFTIRIMWWLPLMLRWEVWTMWDTRPWAGERFSRDWEYPRSCRPWGT
mgnify:CR=1 FL=1